MNNRFIHTFSLAAAWALSNAGAMHAAEIESDGQRQLAVIEPATEISPDFGRDILPILRRNCMACHNSTNAEADVVLESPDDLRAERDEGLLVSAGDLETSRLWQVAAHRDEPIMPPEDNDVGAKPLSPTELGQLKRWIELGAHHSVVVPPSPAIAWQPLPSAFRPIYATAVSASGNYSICARGNQLQVYDLVRGELLTTLVDATLDSKQVGQQGAAHIDRIGAIATYGEGEWIVSGGYGTVKIWHRQRDQLTRELAPTSASQPTHVAASGQLLATTQGSSIYLTSLVDSPVDSPVDEKQQTWDTGESIVALAFSKDSSQLFTASAGGVLRQWHTDNGQSNGGWRLTTAIHSLAVLGNKQLVTADDRVLRVWDLTPATDEQKKSGELPVLKPSRELIGHGRTINDLVASPQFADQVLSGSDDGTMRRWKVTDGTLLQTHIHGQVVSQIAVAPDQSRTASVGDDGTVVLWDTQENREVARMESDFVLSRDLARSLRMVTVAEANLLEVKRTAKDAEDQLTKDRQKLVKSDQTLKNSAKLAQEKESAQKQLQSQQAAYRRVAEKSRISYEQSEQRLAAIKEQLAQLAKQLDPLAATLVEAKNAAKNSPATYEIIVEVEKEFIQARGKQQKQLEDQKNKFESAAAEQKKAHDTRAYLADQLKMPIQEAARAAVSAQHEADMAQEIKQRDTDVVSRAEKTIDRLGAELASYEANLEQRQQIRKAISDDLEQARAPIVSVTFSPDGRQLAIGNHHHKLFVYDARTGKPLDRFFSRANALVYACYVDDRRLATIDDQRHLIVWETLPHWVLHETLGSSTLESPITDRVLALDFSPDGKLLAVGSGEPSRSGQVSIWNVEDGTRITNLNQPHDDTVFALAFSPDGRFLASASADRMMKVFRVADGQFVRAFEGHTHHALDVVWRANGKQLATSGADKQIKIWDFSSGEQMRTIDGSGKEINAISFLGTGNQLVSVSGDRQIRIHNVDNGKQVRSFSGESNYFFCCSATEIGDTIVTGGTDLALRVWSTIDGKERFVFYEEAVAR